MFLVIHAHFIWENTKNIAGGPTEHQWYKLHLLDNCSRTGARSCNRTLCIYWLQRILLQDWTLSCWPLESVQSVPFNLWKVFIDDVLWEVNGLRCCHQINQPCLFDISPPRASLKQSKNSSNMDPSKHMTWTHFKQTPSSTKFYGA